MSKLEILPPDSLLKNPPEIKETLLISGGPTNVYPSAQIALQNPQIGTFAPPAFQVIEDIKEGLRYVFQTKNEWTLAITGPGQSALDAIFDNILEAGDVVFIPSFGHWSDIAADMIQRFGGTVHQIHKPLGSTFTLEEIEDGIKKFKPQVVHLVYAESFSGIVQDMDGVGDICRKHGCLLTVDAAAAIGVMPFHCDKWKIDAAFCNSQKGIGSFIGLAPLTLSPRAIQKILERKTKPKIFRSDLQFLIRTNCWGIDRTRSNTGGHCFLHLLHSLRAALSEIVQEGLENVWVRHERANSALYDGLMKLGCEGFIAPEDNDGRKATILLKPPHGIDPSIFKHHIYDKHGLYISNGTGNLNGKVIRVALIGPNANMDVVNRILKAFKESLDFFANSDLQKQQQA